MKLLVTGFDPFGGSFINPALEAVKQLPDTIKGADIIKLEIPTVFGESAEVVKQAIIEYAPDIVLSIGQAGGRFGVTPERIAINIDDARIPDNKGNQPIDQVIQADGAPAYFTQLPIKAMMTAIKAAGIPSSVSNTAGTFVCNHIMYQVQYMIDKQFPNLRAGFIHVPYIPNQVIDLPNQPAMSVSDISTGISAAISAIITYADQSDLSVLGGEIH